MGDIRDVSRYNGDESTLRSRDEGDTRKRERASGINVNIEQ